MKKLIILGALALVMATSAAAQVVVELPKSDKSKQLSISYALVSDIVNARNESEISFKGDTQKVKKHKAVFALDPSGSARYRLQVTPQDIVDFYAMPDEKINIRVINTQPFSYEISGSALMSGMRELDAELEPLQRQYEIVMQGLRSGTGGSEAELDSILNRFESVNMEFIKCNPESPAVAYAVANLSGENFIDAFENMTETARKSVLYPFAEAMYPAQKQRVEAERATSAMISGHIPAPDFSLPDMSGKEVSLSSLQGKYVILDFWGSWCIWCIKGFPHLKEAYQKYSDKLEVVGVDCGDTDQAWRAAVEKYQLPWLNLYNGDREKSNGVLGLYNVQGFPTKVLIDPAGKIVTIAVGEDPKFYDILDAEMNK